MGKKKVITYIIMAAVVALALLPFTWLIFTSVDIAPSLAARVPEGFTLAHFEKILGWESLRWIYNSVIISVSTATIVLLICIFGAYPFSRFKFRGSDSFLWFFVFLRVFPITAFIVPLYIFLARLGLVDTHLGVIFALVILNLPVPLLLMKGFYDTIPICYEESAWVDGQSRLRGILGVLFPICAPGIAVVWIMTFFSSWAVFIIPFILLRSPDMFPLSVGLFDAWGRYGVVDFGFLSALSIVYLIPPLLIYLFGRRWLVKGMAGLTLR